MTSQLPLTWPAPAHFRLDQFDPAGNTAALAVLTTRMKAPEREGPPLLLVGASGTGKTHLLVGVATLAREDGRRSAYIALSRWSQFDGDALDALASADVLAIDEVDVVAGRREAEVALFDLYNRCLDRGTSLILASRQSPGQLGSGLPDLRSRLEAATLLPLALLDEPSRRRLVQTRARARGFELDEAVIDFLFRHYRRDVLALMALVERLDHESLARQRRVTVPLVRAVIDSQEAGKG